MTSKRDRWGRRVAGFASVLASAGLLAVGAASLAWAEGAVGDPRVDAHAVFEQRCAACHKGHMLDLVRGGKLAVDAAGTVGSASGSALASLLANHHGARVDAADIAALARLAVDISKSGYVFRDKCAMCHVSGRTFALKALELRDGRLVRRSTGTPVADYLAGHGMVSDGERTRVVEMLRRQLARPGD